MKRFFHIIVTVIFLAGHVTFAVSGQEATEESSVASERGTVCLAPIPKPLTGEKSLANPSGGNPDVIYSVQIDSGDEVEFSREEPRLIGGLELKEKHLIKIRVGKELVASFWFNFEEAGTDSLCLFHNELYETWQLWPASRMPKDYACKKE